MIRTEIAILIPAFEPDDRLVSLIAWLSPTSAAAIVVIDDGSGPEHTEYFEAAKAFPKVHLLRHAVNLGKGAALKSGINYVLCELPECQGVVTADADGQHHSEDILKVARRLCENPGKLVLGVRDFGSTVPFRSRVGNQLTKCVMRLVTGQRIADTQTGLRGVPRSLMPQLLKIPAAGYQFELEMLLSCKHTSRMIVEERIRTIYIGANESSHFNPLLDSLRIYFTLFRFSIVSLLTALLDNATFYLMFRASVTLALAQFAGRAVGVMFNYSAARKAVFLSNHNHRVLLPRYLCVVAGSGLISYSLIRYLTSSWSFGILPAKLVVESALFVFNFAVLRDFVFIKSEEGEASNGLRMDSASKSRSALIHAEGTSEIRG